MPRSDSVEVLSEIPDNRTCADCAHVQRCVGLGFTDATTNTFCSFAPSRYLAREVPHAE